MWLQRTLPGLVLALMAASAATAQTGTLRWRTGGPIGLQAARQDFQVTCGSVAFPCDPAANVSLYENDSGDRAVTMQVGREHQALRVGAPGLAVSVLGNAGIAPDLGFYGRIGTTLDRGGASLVPVAQPGFTYGVGIKWNFSRSASAMVGWDSYDLRNTPREGRDVRATSLGLQWRY